MQNISVFALNINDIKKKEQEAAKQKAQQDWEATKNDWNNIKKRYSTK